MCNSHSTLFALVLHLNCTQFSANQNLVIFSCIFNLSTVKHLAIIEWGWVGYEEFCRSRGVLSTKAEVDNTHRDLQNFSYPMKAEFNNCFIIHSKYFLLLKGVSPLRSLIFRSPNITQPCPQVFSVNRSIICSGLHIWRHRFSMAKFVPNLVNGSWLWWYWWW